MNGNATRGYPVRTTNSFDAASEELSSLLNEWLTRNGPPGLFRTCGTCKHMEYSGPAQCKRFNMTPPVDIILRGCDDYQDIAEIPF